LDKAFRLRNYAVELRAIAADGLTIESKRTLVQIAREYERQADALEKRLVASRR